MAGDWIRMRGELWTHPKFLALVQACIYLEDSPGMLVYACGEDTLGIGGLPPSNESVTLRALRHVTPLALRDVTMCALLRVWCAVNAHAKVDGYDAVCCPMDITWIDDIAGFDGFGKAMESVGWVVERDDNALVFPNFCEHNSPACLRPQAKSNAERQRLFRERQRSRQSRKSKSKSRNETVTRCNDREDEMRVDERREDEDVIPSSTPSVPKPAREGEVSALHRLTDRIAREFGLGYRKAALAIETQGTTEADVDAWVDYALCRGEYAELGGSRRLACMNIQRWRSPSQIPRDATEEEKTKAWAQKIADEIAPKK